MSNAEEPSQRRRITICVVLLGLVATVVGPGIVRAQYPILAKLNFEDVRITISSSAELKGSDVLAELAVKTLAEAGLNPVSANLPWDESSPILEIHLRVFNLGESGNWPELGKTCTGKWLYMQRAELWEWVYTKRNPDQPIWAATWRRTVPLPVIRNEIPLEQLKKDFEQVLGEFIWDYKQSHPVRDKKR